MVRTNTIRNFIASILNKAFCAVRSEIIRITESLYRLETGLSLILNVSLIPEISLTFASATLSELSLIFDLSIYMY